MLERTRIYTWFEVRAVDEEKRIITGIATTPQQARDGDILETAGIQFKLPIPFLFKHREEMGNVTKAQVRADGIEVEVQIAPAGVAESIDEAWRKIKAGVVRGLSIGWRTISEAYDKDINGYRIFKSEWLELSAVPVPADTGATITSIRSADDEILAALGRSTDPSAQTPKPGVSGKSTRKSKSSSKEGAPMNDFRDKLQPLETRLSEVRTRMNELLSQAVDGIFSPEQAEEAREFDSLSTEQSELKINITRLRSMQETLETAQPPVAEPKRIPPRNPAPIRQFVEMPTPKLEKGTAFARMAIALFAARGSYEQAARFVERERSAWLNTTPDLARALRAAIAMGDTTTSGWAAELVPLQNYTGDFVEFLRPMTIVGRIQGFRNVPFNVSIKVQDGGTEGSWVGEGSVKPISKLHFDQPIELKILKCSSIVAMSDELVRLSTPSVETLVRTDLAEGLAVAIDKAFIDHTNGGTPTVKPASVLNGAANDSASGTTANDLIADATKAFQQFTDNNLPLSGLVFVMQESQALALSLMLNALGQPQFPTISAAGGTLFGYPVITSQSVPTGIIALIKPSEIYLADDGGATIDMSNQATLLMDDGASPAGTTNLNLWQQNALALRAERFINFKLRRSEAAYYISGCAYAQPASE